MHSLLPKASLIFSLMYIVTKLCHCWELESGYQTLYHLSFLMDFICLIQAWECTPGREAPWNILSLFTTSGMLFLEVSLMAFLLQGNHASGREALTRTFVISGLIVGFDILLKVLYSLSPSPCL